MLSHSLTLLKLKKRSILHHLVWKSPAVIYWKKTFLVANSDGNKAIWYAFDLGENDSISEARVFYDATKESKAGDKGLPDGLRIDSSGNVFASGPGGIWIFDAAGKVLGKIRLTESASNCALSDDEKTLFITNDMYVLRVKLRD